MREGEKKEHLTLDNDATIYSKREETKFKDLNKADKWQYFKDYILGKLVGALVMLGILIYFLVSVLSPKAVSVCSVAIIDSPLGVTGADSLQSKLTEALVTDSESEKVTVDDDFYFASNDVNAHIKLSTFVAAGDLDIIILPEDVYQDYYDKEIYEDVSKILSEDNLAKLSEITTVSKYCIDCTDIMNKYVDGELSSAYKLVFVKEAKHIDNADTFVDILFFK